MNRTPPIDVRRELGQEVGFGCPVPNCGKPYLEWHHFDPPWRILNHHNPKGMIALCSEHHPKADVGAFTAEQLHNFKLNGANNHKEIRGKFDWLRNKILFISGGCFYYETLIILQYRDVPIIWFRRDADGYLLLNIRMLTTSNEPRLFLEDNCWIEKGTPVSFECPPSGKLIHARYLNGDEIRIEFIQLSSQTELQKRYPLAKIKEWNNLLSMYIPDGEIPFPITVVEVSKNIAGTNINFSPTITQIGTMTMQGGFFAYCGSVINL